MKQYEFEATNRQRGNVERIRATAKNEAIARAHIVHEYGAQFEIAEACCDVNPPHHVLGEIDCSSPEHEAFALALIATRSAHTPGPWSVNNWPQATTDIAIGAVGTPLIAKVPLRDVSINEQKANAALIAAAPDLLAALDALINAPWSGTNVDNARAAIAKAGGAA